MRPLVSYTPLETQADFVDSLWLPLLLAVGGLVLGAMTNVLISYHLNKKLIERGEAPDEVLITTIASAALGSGIGIILALCLGFGVNGVAPTADEATYQLNTADWISQEYGIETYVESGRLSIWPESDYPVQIKGEQDGKSITATIDPETGELLNVEPWLSTDRTNIKG
jgi:hypothetical protein